MFVLIYAGKWKNAIRNPYRFSASAASGAAGITVSGVAMNLVCVTVGNIVGGVLVAIAYWTAYAPKSKR